LIVTVSWATPEVQDIVPVEVAPGARVARAVCDCELIARYGLDAATLRFARFGVNVDADTILEPGDRIDILRGLLADPKATRARRARTRSSSGKAVRGAQGNAR
jgi:hypothetical protein